MSELLPPLVLTGAQVLRGGRLRPEALAIAGGRIGAAQAGAARIDLSGYLLLPGIVDLHGDGFERHIAPRPSAPFPIIAGLRSVDREAAAHGVTTAYLAQGWSWEGGHRSPDYAERVLQALDDYRPEAITDLRVQLRAEVHMTEATGRLADTVQRHGVGFVVFNDHLAEGFEMHAQAPQDFALWARKVGLTPEAMLARLNAAAAQAPVVPDHLRRLSAVFAGLGLAFGSHDDPDAATRARFAALGADIAEFPITRAAAEAARAGGNPILMGAPNVVRGRSQAGNIAARDLVAADLCDVLVSDYHLPALALAAWTLVDEGLATLPAAWAMVSTNAAKALKLDDRGRLEPGLRADLVVVNAATRAVEATVTGGRLAHLSGAAAGRFLARDSLARLAAE
jgi:alpha-D-ribose 1-methylphosphonate 5-triphosphate diphosphatase